MDNIQFIGKFIHILCGALTLLLGLLQIILPKHGKIHRGIGSFYFWLMVVIFITALPPAIYKQNWFLACVAIFSLYLVWTGKRYGANKSLFPSIHVDKFVTILGAMSALGMYVVSILFFLKGYIGMAIAPLVFGSLTFIFSKTDYYYYFLKIENKRYGKMHWYFNHISRMIGSYIAAITAFIVNIQPLGPHWIHWIWPTVVGSFLIAWFTRKNMKRMGLVSAE